MPRKKPFLMTKLVQNRLDPDIIHCILDQPYPFGRHKALWEIKFMVKPIDIRNPDDGDLRVILATIQVNERGGEKIVSEFEFRSHNAVKLYNPPPLPPRLLQFEYAQRILFSIYVKDVNLDKGFKEVYPLLQLSEHTICEQTRIAVQLHRYGHGSPTTRC
jgi:hypothetical protein